MSNRWDHSICDGCWWRSNQTGPHRLVKPRKTRCCYCGVENSSGIFVRDDPAKTLCRGIHPEEHDESAAIYSDYIALKQYVLRQDAFKRWLIALAGREGYAWSGYRWVPVGGSVQTCNFDSEDLAHAYAVQAGLMPAPVLSDEQIRAIWRGIANGVGNQGEFLRSLGDAVIRADTENFPILRQAAIFFIRKYQLDSLAAGSAGCLSPGKEESANQLLNQNNSEAAGEP